VAGLRVAGGFIRITDFRLGGCHWQLVARIFAASLGDFKVISVMLGMILDDPG
jgi:hypothetical protein